MAYRDHWIIVNPSTRSIYSKPFLTYKEAKEVLNEGLRDGTLTGYVIEFIRGWKR